MSFDALLATKKGSAEKLSEDEKSIFLRNFSRGTHRRRLTQDYYATTYGSNVNNATLPQALIPLTNPSKTQKVSIHHLITEPHEILEKSTLPKMLIARQTQNYKTVA